MPETITEEYWLAEEGYGVSEWVLKDTLEDSGVYQENDQLTLGWRGR